MTQRLRQKLEVRSHLGFLDGVRGFAALYIVIYHCAISVYKFSDTTQMIPLLFNLSFLFIRHRWAVATFIVLSGYCLTLSVLSNGKTFELKGGFKSYILRRARRILPVYYAALGVCLVLIALIPALSVPHHLGWDTSLPAFQPDIILSHLVLVHNWSPAWIQKIDYPLWSVATEWQIYFLFPVLLYLMRKIGVASAALIVILVASAIAPLSAALFNHDLYGAAPWYLGLFAMGSVSAISAQKVERQKKFKNEFSWHRVALIGGIVSVLTLSFWVPDFVPFPSLELPIHENLIGIAAALSLFYLTIFSKAWSTRFFQRPFAVALGGISYSLYVIHAPVVALLHVQLLRWNLNVNQMFFLLMLLGCLSSLGVAYVLSKHVEERFRAS